ncbi:MAG: 50S ribosomal protein L30 [candidate division WOR-3 bacterium]
MRKLRVTLKKSLIDQKPCHRKTAAALGLRRIGECRTYQDTPQVRGMITVVRHLVEVEEYET